VSQKAQFKDVRHIVRVVVIIVVVAVGFLVARFATVPKSFGQYGHYRGESLDEDMSLPVILQSPQTCRECHEEETGEWPGYEVWQKGKHSSLICENCHSNCQEHVEARGKEPDLKKDVITKDPTPQRCLMCHYGLAAKPKVLPLCLPDKHHAGYLKLLEQPATKTLSCTVGGCHTDFRPHNPKLVKKTQ
jgi:hypothetical protein